MSGPVAQAGAAAALALGLALLATPRLRPAAALCAAQAVAVALVALAQGEQVAALAELAFGGALAWWGRRACQAAYRRTPLATGNAAWPASSDGFRHSGQRGSDRRSRAFRASRLLAGAMLAAIAAAVPGTGIAFAVVFLGLLVLTTDTRPSHQVLGLVAMQAGLALAATAVGLAGWSLGLALVPLLPAVGIAALWLGANNARLSMLLAPPVMTRIDAGLCTLALLGACILPWRLGGTHGIGHLDARAAHMVLLLAALAAAGSWGEPAARPVWGSRLMVLAGTVPAVLSDAPLLAWPAMLVATAGVIAAALPARAEAWRRLRLGCLGLALALAGTIAASASPPPLAAVAVTMLGYGSLAVLAPELAVAAIALILRLPAPAYLLVMLGLAALLIAALGLATPRGRRQLALPLVGLAQGGVAVFSFGLGTAAGAFAGLLQITLLALTQCALRLAQPNGWDRLAALAGLAGAPPFGLFASLALILEATAATAPLLLLPLGIGLAAIAWAVLPHLPAERRLCLSPAWLPLALLLLCGFAMPEPWLTWFRLAAK